MNVRNRYRSILHGLCGFIGVAALSPAAVAGTTWFVSPCGSDGWIGVNVNCVGPGGPKRTIQAAINAATDGDTVLVLPGTYLETIDLDGKGISLISSGGPGVTTIDGNDSGPVVTINSGEGNDTLIQGFHITSGSTTVDGGAMLIVLSSPTIVDCTLSGNGTTGNGAAMAVFAGAPIIDDCIIAFNEAGAEPPAAGKGLGAGIYAISSNITISNTFMQTCYATRRGALMALVNSIATIADCDFYTSGTTFSHGDGGGIYLDGSTATISNCLFDGVNAWSPNSEGGSILAVNGSEVTCTGTAFQESSAEVRGGAVSILNSSASFVGCEFTDLVAASGGGIYVENGTLTANWCGFNSLEAWTAEGGAVRAQNSTLDFGLCTFNANIAATIGGAIATSGGSISLGGCVLSNNTANSSGGAVAATMSDVSVQSCTFAGNEGLDPAVWGSHGGGLYVWTLTTDVEITDSTFEDNQAAHGGGLWVSALAFGGSSQLSVSECTFDGNHAYVDGGGATIGSVSPQTYRLSGCTFINNTAATYAGALVSTGVGHLVVDHCIFQANSAPNGGAVSCSANNESYGEVTFNSCRFNLNTATESGAAVRVSSLAKIRMVNCVVHNNTAPVAGGAIADTIDGFWQGRFDLVNCTVANNNGGGIMIDAPQTTSTVSNSIIWGNPNGGQFVGTQPLVRYSDVQGGAVGVGIINANPLFLGALGGNYRLNAGSPCVDAGHNWALPADAFDLNTNGDTMELWPGDFDGNPRITDNPAIAGAGCSPIPAIVDMGAFETVGVPAPFPVLLADLNGDGVVSVPDLLMLINAWGKCGGCCTADLNLDGEINVPDLLLLINHWG